jgi:hypothetical protein
MSSTAKIARDAMKAKAKRLAAGDPHTKVDSSTWTPSEPENAGVKTGARPLTKRLYKKGGKVIGKADGKKAAFRADRMPRKSGGRAEADREHRYLTPDNLINRDVRMANDAREGTKHTGAFKKGGRAHKTDGGKTISPLGEKVKRLAEIKNLQLKSNPRFTDKGQWGDWEQERSRLESEISDSKKRAGLNYKSGGRAHKFSGGVGENPVGAQDRMMGKAAGMMKKGGRAHHATDGKVKKPINWSQVEDEYRPSTQDPNYVSQQYNADAERQLENLANTRSMAGTPTASPDYPQARKHGGKAEKWIQSAIKHPGSLHKALHVPAGEKIPAKKLEKATHSSNPKLAKKAHLAETLKHMHHAKGGKAMHPDEAEDKKLIKKMIKPTALREHKAMGGMSNDHDSHANWMKRREETAKEIAAKKAANPGKSFMQIMLDEAGDLGKKHGEYLKSRRTGQVAPERQQAMAEGRNDGPSMVDMKAHGGRTKKYSGGGIFSGDSKSKVPGVTGGREARATGGKAKGKTQVNIVIATGRGQQPMGGMMPNAPVPAPRTMPAPAAGMPNPMMAGAPQGGMPPMPPQGMPMPRKRGGRTGYPIDSGAGGGEARLEKIDAYGAVQPKLKRK